MSGYHGLCRQTTIGGASCASVGFSQKAKKELMVATGSQNLVTIVTLSMLPFVSFILTGKKVLRDIARPDARGRALIHIEVYLRKIVCHVFHLVTVGLVHS